MSLFFARYATAVHCPSSSTLDAALDALFPEDTSAALRDGRRGELYRDVPLLVDPGPYLAAMGHKADELTRKAGEYAALMTSWFVFADGVRLEDTLVTALAEPWNGFPVGAVALRLRTSRGEVVFVRDDVTVGLNSGNVFHAVPRLGVQNTSAFSVEDGSVGDGALTIAEYAAFMIPGVGPIAAGIMNVFHTWLRKPRKAGMPNEQVVKEVGILMKKLKVADDEAAVTGSYMEYSSAMANARDDHPKSIADFRDVAIGTLGQNAPLVAAFNSLTFNPSIATSGARAWTFAASFMLLALRHTLELDSQKTGKPITESVYWRRLRLAYHEIITHIGDVMSEEAKGLRQRLEKIGDVQRLTHEETFCTDTPSGGGICKRETYFDGYGFDDDGKRVCLRAPQKKKSEDDLRNAAVADRNAYVASKRSEFLRGFYEESDAAVTQILAANASLAIAWHDSFEDTILASVKGWRPPDDYPVLAAWPGKGLSIETSNGAKAEPWKTFLDPQSGEMKSNFLTPEQPVFRYIGSSRHESGGGSLRLKVAAKADTVHALRVRYVTDEDVRTFRVYWDYEEKPRNDASGRIVAPNSHHQDAKQNRWLSRTITIPVESTRDGGDLIIDGYDGWAPDIVSLEWFELQDFPRRGA